MIDLGISKLILIGIVALVVIGPERLPHAARTLGALFGRAQRYVNLLKTEVRRELEDPALAKLQQEIFQAQHDVKQKIKTLSMSTQGDIDPLASSWRVDAKPGTSPKISMHSFRAAKPHGRIAAWRLRQTALPKWFKQRTGLRSQLRSGAARVKRYRPASQIKKDFFDTD